MLLRDPGFVTTLQAHGGKATETERVMRAEAAKLGFGGDAATPDVFWRANASLRSIDNHLWDAKWSALSSYLIQLREGSSCYTHWKTNADNTFRYYFVAFYSVRDLLQTNGRPVCSTDMGHFKHQLFEGMNATGTTVVYYGYCCCFMHCFFVGNLATIVILFKGLFQLGDGTLIALWSAVFAHTSETNNMWEICADQIVCAGQLCNVSIKATLYEYASLILYLTVCKG